MPGSNLRNILENIQPARKAIFDSLCAIDIATLCYALPISLSKAEKKQYLTVIRDFGEQGKWMEDEIKTGNDVAIVGIDLEVLVDRILNPLEYWKDRKDYGRHERVKAWIIVSPSTQDIDGYESRVKAIAAKVKALKRRDIAIYDPELPTDEEPATLLPEEVEEKYVSSVFGTAKECRLGHLVGMYADYEKKKTEFKRAEGRFSSVRIRDGKPDMLLKIPSSRPYGVTRIGDWDWFEQNVSDNPRVEVEYYTAPYNFNKPLEWVPPSLFGVDTDSIRTCMMTLNGQGQRSSQFEFKVSEPGSAFFSSCHRKIDQLGCRRVVNIYVKLANGEKVRMMI